MSEGRRARPQPTPETQHFWDGTRAGELRLQRCNACGKVYFPPRPFCICAGFLVAACRFRPVDRNASAVLHIEKHLFSRARGDKTHASQWLSVNLQMPS
jgi:hypothetical protein